MTIPVFKPTIDPGRVWQHLQPVIASGWLGEGPKVAELERRLADEVRAKHFICTSSCTAALHLAIHCLDLRPGWRILTSPITFISSTAAILWNGHVPVFGEVDPRSGLLIVGADVGTVSAALIVHLGGARCPMPNQQPWPVVEDCAHAFGAPWLTDQGSNMRCWSFHAVKNLPMGDGGGISTNDDALAERLRRLRWLGISKSTYQRSGGQYVTDYDIPELGWKYHMNDVTAAVGLAAIGQVSKQNMRRRQIAYAYQQAFPDCAPSYEPCESACHFYPLFFEDRIEVERRLQEAGIGYSRHYKPNFLYGDILRRLDLLSLDARSSALAYYDRALVLPIFPAMTDAEVARVVEVVRDV